MSPPAAASGRWISHSSISISDGCRSAMTGGECTALRLYRPGCGGRWGACANTRCVSVPTSWLPERLGRAGRIFRPWPPRLAGAAPTPAGSPPWAGVPTPPGGAASDSLELGGGMLSGDSRKRCPPPPALFLHWERRWGSARSMAMLTSELTGSLPGNGERTVTRPAGPGAPVAPGRSGQRQLPG